MAHQVTVYCKVVFVCVTLYVHASENCIQIILHTALYFYVLLLLLLRWTRGMSLCNWATNGRVVHHSDDT